MRRTRTQLRNVTTLGVAAVAGTGIALWPASPASAQQPAQQGAWATVDPPGGSQLFAYVDYHAGDGEANDVTITDGEGPREYVIDDVVPIEAREGCVHPDEVDLTRVVCTVAPGDEASIDVDLGDMNDTIDADSGAGGEVYAGPGDDTLTTTWSTVWWGLDGEEGDDTLSGSIDMRGGEGNDTITGPEVADETSVYGDAGRDTITTFGSDDIIWGDRGLTTGEGAADEIRAGGGNDRIYGEYGDDTLYGEAGDDVIKGGPGDDDIDGGPGDDEEIQD